MNLCCALVADVAVPVTVKTPAPALSPGPPSGLLEETPSCSREATGYSQSCPDSDRDGFVLSGELEEDWQNLDQVEVIVYHSWIAEYARVANVTRVGGRQVKSCSCSCSFSCSCS